MVEQQHSVEARTGTTELHHTPSAFGITAPGFVALAMLVVVAIMVLNKVPAMIGKMLDARIDTIKRQLDEAKALRAEAEAMLAQAKARHAASADDAAKIVAQAKEESRQMIEKAEADAATLIERRSKMAEDKIAAAERQAIAEVRAKAADVAAAAAGKLIAGAHDAAADKALVDRTISGLSRLN